MIRLDRPVLILTPDDLPLLRYAVGQAQRARRLDGLPPAAALERLAALLADLGHTDSPEPPHGNDEHTTATWMDTGRAAQALGVSERTARRMAPALGGRKHAGSWLLDAAAVTEHLEGLNP